MGPIPYCTYSGPLPLNMKGQVDTFCWARSGFLTETRRGFQLMQSTLVLKNCLCIIMVINPLAQPAIVNKVARKT